MEVGPTLYDEPEMLIRDPVHEDGEDEALFEVSGEEATSHRSCLLVQQALVFRDPGDDLDAHVDILSLKNILRLSQRVIMVDSVRTYRTLLSFASVRTGFLPFFFSRERIMSPQ